jgi:OOP family OmpA-OmpF porin
VVGHTDSVGKIDYNMQLSNARAEAVVKTLITKYGVSQNRLDSYGVGPLAPVASNETEEGRALNRRVELVKE